MLWTGDFEKHTKDLEHIEQRQQDCQERMTVLRGKISSLQAGIEGKLGTEKVSSFKQLCRVNASLQSFAAVADKAAAEVEGVQEAWMDDMQHMVHVTEFVVEASDLALQRRLVYNLKMMLNNGTRPFINFLAESQPPNSLEPGPSVNKLWLEDGGMQQSAGSLPAPKAQVVN